MAELNRQVASLRLEYEDLAERIQRTFVNGYKRVVEDDDTDAAVQAFAELLATSADAMFKAEEAAAAAKSVRIAIIRCQVAAGMTMEDVGAVHGLTRQRISQLLRSEPELRPIVRKRRRRSVRKGES
ncbi:MAG TPA: hypothetical protein VHG52_15200 [Thermomicrobiales bacterium]|nr:hypothetical protein [Thermomicrobiales bacterium]